MALSDREKKVLEQLERDLYGTDGKFERRVQRQALPSVRALVAGAALAVVGISVTVFAVMAQLILFGVLGFLLLLTGLVLASSNWSDKKSSATQSKTRAPRDNFFEDRWNRRQGE
jgi:hypothetical protein